MKPDKQLPIVTFETFRRFGHYEQHHLKSDTPSCHNSIVSIRKYRISVELIDEPNGVLVGRLKDLWERCDNFHHVGNLKAVAKELGVASPEKEWGWIGSKLKAKL